MGTTTVWTLILILNGTGMLEVRTPYGTEEECRSNGELFAEVSHKASDVCMPGNGTRTARSGA